MKIQKTYKASLFALTMLFTLPASVMAADGKWDRMLDALHHSKAASHISKQDRAILAVTILLRAHRPEQAMSMLEEQPETPLIKQLKVQAAREHLVEVVRRAGGTRSEVKLPAPSAELSKALADADARLNTFMQALVPVQQDELGQSVRVGVGRSHAAAPAHSEVQDISRTFLEQMTPARRWAYMLDVLEHNRLRASKQLSKQDRTVLIIAVLLKSGQPAQALKVLESQSAGELTRYLKTKATEERIINAVIRAGGSRSEVRLPAHSTAMDDAMASVDARLQTFMRQLDQEKNKPASAVRPAVPEVKKAVAAMKARHQNSTAVTGKRVSEVREAEKLAAAHATNQPVSAEVRMAVLQAIEAWRSAWSDRNVDAYFAAYADDFDVTGRFASMDAWKAYKRWVIGKRSVIQVTLDNIQLDALPDDQVRVEFLQHFRADSYQTDDLKALILRPSDDGWKIISEASI